MRPILALILSLILTVPVFALSGATADGEDRFPYVVEIKFEQRLVCSGTVLFPRIVSRPPIAYSTRPVGPAASSISMNMHKPRS